MAAMALPRRHSDLAKCATADEQRDVLFGIFKDALPDLTLFGSDLLVATYVRSSVISSIKQASGDVIQLFGTDNHSQEDLFQGKAALVLAMGPTAFRYDRFNSKWEGPQAKVGDWILFRYAEAGMDTDYRGVYCRFIDSSIVRGVIKDPALVY